MLFKIVYDFANANVLRIFGQVLHIILQADRAIGLFSQKIYACGFQTVSEPWPQKPSYFVTLISPKTLVWQDKRRFDAGEWGGSESRAFSRHSGSETSPSMLTAQVPQVPSPWQLITLALPL